MTNKEAGLTIIEVLVALSAVLVVLSAITAIVLTSLNQATGSRSIGEASQYAQEGMELATGRGNFNLNDVYCLRKDNSWSNFGVCSSTLPDPYRREVRVASTNCPGPVNITQKRRVTVTVSWRDSKCQGQSYCRTVSTSSCI